jgi:uncharacterized protein DUF4326
VSGVPKVINVRDRSIPRESYVYVGRRNARYGFPESPFANPFKVGRDGTLAEVVAKFGAYLSGDLALLERARQELRGRDLGCWCKKAGADVPCHADVLLRVANS